MVLSAPLLTKKEVIKIKLEAEKGTQIATDQAIRVYDLDIRPTAPFEQRKSGGLYLGNNNTGIVGEMSGKATFSVEMRGTGTSGMELGLAILLQCCGFKKTLEVYNLHSTVTDQETCTIETWEDGVKKAIHGAMGNISFEGEAGKRVLCKFEFFGIWNAPIDEAMPAWVPSTATPLKLAGGTFTLATESIKIATLGLDIGNNVVMRGDVAATGGIAYYMITDYDPTLTIDPEADKVAGHDFYGLWLAGTEAAVSLGLTDGTDTVTFTIPKVQYKEVAPGDREGIKIYDLTGQCNHSAGNDAVSITVT